MKSNKAVLEQLKKDKKQAARDNAKQRENTKRCRAAYAGDYMEYSDKIQFSTADGQKKRVTVQINKIKPYVNAVKGFFAQNRRKPNYLARMQESAISSFYSQYTNKLSEYLRGHMNADQVETQQNGDQLICGMGVVETALSYGEGYASTSANGEVLMGCVDLDTFWYDGKARQTNLLDARFKGVTKTFALDDALELFDDSEEEDFETGEIDKSGGYNYSSELGSYDRIKYDWSDKDQNMVNVDFYQWFDIETFYRADNPASSLKNPAAVNAARIELMAIQNEVAEDDDDFNPDDEILSFNAATKEKLVEAFGEFIAPEQFRRKVYYMAVASGDKLFKKMKSDHQGGFTLKVKTGDYDAKNKIWTGMVNSMIEPSKYFNKALTELMFIIAANSKGGYIVEEDAVEDIEEFEDQVARTDAVCVVRPGALTGAGGRKIVSKREPFQPTGYEKVIEIADMAIQDTSTINKNFLGSAENGNDTAQLQRQRIRQVVSTMACYIDSHDLYGKDHARMMLDLMRIYAENNRGDLFPAEDDQGTIQFLQISEDKLAPDYYVMIGDAPTTPEEKQEMADKLTLIGDKYLAAQQVAKADAFYAMAARYMSLDIDDMQELLKILQPDGEQMSPQDIQALIAENQQLKSAMTQATVNNMNKLSEKAEADAKKALTEADLNETKQAQVRADVHKKAAETSKTLEDADKTHIENNYTKAHPKQIFNPSTPAGA